MGRAGGRGHQGIQAVTIHHAVDAVLARPLAASGQRLQEVSLTLRCGEILGLAGLVGAGRSELAQALFGLDPERTGTVSVAGHPLPPGDVVAAMEAGVGLLPEDRKRQGLVLGLNCRENGALAVLQRWSRWGWMDRRRERDQMEALVRQLRVKAPSIESGIAGPSFGGYLEGVGGLVDWRICVSFD